MMPRCCLLALIATILFGPIAFGQDDAKGPTIPFDGPEVFCYLLANRKLAPVRELAELGALSPAETVVIVFGNDTGRLLNSLGKFHDSGGAVLFASDFPGALADWGVRVANDTIQQDDQLAYRNNADCPLILALARDKPAEFHVLPRGLAMNRPRFFLKESRKKSAPLRALANLPDGCWAAFGQTPADAAFMLFAEGKNATPGRTLLIPGHGLFTNGMLVQDDNDNFEFAVSCLRWLGAGPDGARRRHALFIVDGKVIPSFDVALKPPLPPIPVPTLQVVNQLMHGLERENFFVNLLRDNVNIRGPLRLTLILLTVSLLVYGVKKLGDQRHRAEVGSALLVGPFATPATQSPLIRQRFAAQVQRDALWEEARALARQWWLDMGGIPVGDWDRLPMARPDIEVAAGWWESRRLGRQADRLFQLAGEHTPVTFSWRELVRLTRAIQNLNEAMHEGRLRTGGCSDAEKS
jgi:hypothetical protein